MIFFKKLASFSTFKGGTRTILFSGSLVIIIKGRYSIEGEPKIIFDLQRNSIIRHQILKLSISRIF